MEGDEEMDGMTSMKMDKKKDDQTIQGSPPSPEYPGGLSMNMGSDEIEKLGLGDAQVGDEMEVVAKGKVTSKSMEDMAPGGGGMGGMGGGGKKKMSMGFQITNMGMKPMKQMKPMGGGMKMGKGPPAGGILGDLRSKGLLPATNFMKASASKRLLGAIKPTSRADPMTPKPMKPRGMKRKTDGMDDM